MALKNYVDKNGLRFFYQQIKALITKTGMSVINISSETVIPKRTESGVSVYYVNGSNTTIPSGIECNKIPSDAPETDIFIMDNCYLDETSGKLINTYVIFADSAFYTGSITTESDVDTVGEWSKASDPSDYMVTLTQSEYDDLEDGGAIDPDVMYFITDGSPSGEGGGSSTSTGIALTQAEYDALTDAEKASDNVYFITDSADNASTVAIGLTQEQYNAIPDSVKNNDGKIYFISDASLDILLMTDIINVMHYKGELNSLSNLPSSGMSLHDYYYILSAHEGRYWNGTTWKIVR